MQVVNSSSVWMNTSSSKKQQHYAKSDRVGGAVFKYIFFLMLLGFFCSLFYIWSRIQVVNIGYEINRSLALKEKLLEENKKLTLDAAILKSPVRLEALAHNQFQMDLPQKSQILNQMIPAKPVETVAKLEKTKKSDAKVAVKNIQKTKMEKTPVKAAQKSQKDTKQKSAKKQDAKSALKVATAVSSSRR